MIPQAPARLLAEIRQRPQLFVGFVVALSVGIWALVGATLVFGYSAIRGLPDSAAVRTVGVMPRATTLVDIEGRHAFSIFQEQRMHVPLAKMSPHLIRAIVVAEDQRFYNHGGFDVIRVAGAGLNNVMAGRAEQGGSTITQQLARLTFLTPGKTFRRKLQEVVLAIRLERAFSKDEILELYLNKAYFGDGLYGVEAASLGYLGKHAQDLDVGEAALIAGLVKSPSAYSPTASVPRAQARRNLVLRLMHERESHRSRHVRPGAACRRRGQRCAPPRGKRTGSTSRKRFVSSWWRCSAGSACPLKA